MVGAAEVAPHRCGVFLVETAMQVRPMRERRNDEGAHDGGKVTAAELALVGHIPAEGQQGWHRLLLTELDVRRRCQVRGDHVAK
eukprot:9807532-Lingulodinium_polyedra.AAC.1